MGCSGSKGEDVEVASRGEHNKSPSTESSFGVPKSEDAIGGDDPFGQRVSSNPLFRQSMESAAGDGGGGGEADITDTHNLEETEFGFGSDTSRSPSPAEPEPPAEPEKSKADIKKERDLAGLAEKRKEDRAAKLAAMKAKREAKKTEGLAELNAALAIIDGLME